MRTVLIINKKYPLSKENKSIKNSLIRNNIKCIEISNNKKQTSLFRKEFENILIDFDRILLFEIYHITTDIRYLFSISKNILILFKDEYLTKNFFESEEKVFNHSFRIVKDYIIDINKISGNIYRKSNIFNRKQEEYTQTIRNFNKELLASTQKIGRELKKEKINSSKATKYKKTYIFGRPKNKLSKSKLDNFKIYIKKFHQQNYSNYAIHKLLQEKFPSTYKTSLTTLVHYVKTRF